MKKIVLGLFCVAFLSLISCNNDDMPEGYADFVIATPLKADLVKFKAEAIGVSEPVPITESGKIYAYQNYIFVNDVGRGFHVLDNSNPEAPQNIAFIKLEGNFDISIKNDRLYADSYGDLVILDISDINNIGNAKRIENAIYQDFWCTVGFDVNWPEADYFDYTDFDFSREAIVGWELETKRMRISEFNEKYGYAYLDNVTAFNEAAVPTTSDTGQGGSLARFKIVEDYLYAIESFSINVFDISDLDAPKVMDEVYTNGIIETIFNQGDILFLGGTQGMYIYDISSPEKPTYVSEFVHGTACDPVVVDGSHAFVTLRGGNVCGGVESGLYIVDIADLTKPELKKFYTMTEPFGLGIRDEKLFICDGPAGLKVYDKTNVEDLVLLDHFDDIITYDVIPSQNSLLMIGDNVLYQYAYEEQGLRLLSSLAL